MGNTEKMQQFEGLKVRTVWNEDEGKWYFSIVDVCWILAESKDHLTARKYWNKLKERLLAEGNQTVTNCHQLKMTALMANNSHLDNSLDTVQLTPPPERCNKFDEEPVIAYVLIWFGAARKK